MKNLKNELLSELHDTLNDYVDVCGTDFWELPNYICNGDYYFDNHDELITFIKDNINLMFTALDWYKSENNCSFEKVNIPQEVFELMVKYQIHQILDEIYLQYKLESTLEMTENDVTTIINALHEMMD